MPRPLRKCTKAERDARTTPATILRSGDRALDALQPGGPRTGYHEDLAPDGALSERAAAVLDACQSAWVFGGMGSWNDLGFVDARKTAYEASSERLFSSLLRAIVAAANSSATG